MTGEVPVAFIVKSMTSGEAPVVFTVKGVSADIRAGTYLEGDPSYTH
ncbi:MAG: hypothetical protein LUQ25_05350 [Methanoregulaceae archaeon]|nr:hypothetical protein [Methanoregulaceae archaeon]